MYQSDNNADQSEQESAAEKARNDSIGAGVVDSIKRGWVVFPIRPGKKRPSIDWDDPAEWIDDPATARRLWGVGGEHRGWNYGVVCGPSNIVVVDIDLKNEKDGLARLKELCAEKQVDFDTLWNTRRHGTPSGGTHLLFQAREDYPLGNTQNKPVPGVDLRGRGGYIVGPGSYTIADEAERTAEGTYEVAADGEASRLPAWFAASVTETVEKIKGDAYGLSGLVERILADSGDPEAGDEWFTRACGYVARLCRRADLPLQDYQFLVRAIDQMRDDPQNVTKDHIFRKEMAKGPEAGSETEPGGSWELVDLGPVLSGEIQTPDPTVLARTDGACLLYPGSIHWIFGEPESGKSWLTLAACAEQIRQGRNVLYIDLENGRAELVSRLLALGLTPDQIRSRFHIIEPESTIDSGRYAAHLEVLRPAVVVVDAFTEVADIEGLNPNEAEAVSRVVRLYMKPAERAGAAVVAIDHVVKDTDRRGLWPSGSQHKKSAVSGSALLVRMIDQFAPGQVGRADLVLAKDRRGKVRAVAPGRQAGVFVLDSTGETSTWKVTPGAPALKRAAPTSSALSDKAAEIVRVLDQAGADLEIGRPAATDLLRSRKPGFRAASTVYGEAIRYRKERAE